jgi:hypothetical protein
MWVIDEGADFLLLEFLSREVGLRDGDVSRPRQATATLRIGTPIAAAS